MAVLPGKIADNLLKLRERIDAAALRSGRDPAGISLVAVSKLHPAEAAAAAYLAGQRLFGENRVQEAGEKFPALRESCPDIEVHMIGHLQSNKAKAAAGIFSCVQSLDSIELARKLSAAAQACGRTLGVFIELHTGEESKAGFRSPEEALACLDILRGLPFLQPRGLMTMAPFTRDPQPIRASFRALAALGGHWQAQHPDLAPPLLSMGMSNDYEIAVEEGSTMLRIGTAIFGEAS